VDPLIETFCREFIKPGAHVWDLGANVGVFSFTAAFFAGSKGSVLSVEPDPFLAHLIQKTESSPHPAYAPVSVITAAVSKESGFAVLEVPERSRASNAIIGKSECTQRGGVRARLEVRVVTADQLAVEHPRPSVVKMDVEGSELDALLGGQEAFFQARPVFLMEVQQKNQSGVTQILKGWDYRFYPLGAALKPESELSCAVDDIIAIPK
jgi:FkbM family methyltransferase